MPAPDAHEVELSWSPQRELHREEWAKLGGQLGRVVRGVGFLIGDWLLYGLERYGERAMEAPEITGLSVFTLDRLATVARAVPPERRRADLSWSHHAEVAPLEPDDQASWLEWAASKRVDSKRLRAAIAAQRKGLSERLTVPDGYQLTVEFTGKRELVDTLLAEIEKQGATILKHRISELKAA